MQRQMTILFVVLFGGFLAVGGACYAKEYVAVSFDADDAMVSFAVGDIK